MTRSISHAGGGGRCVDRYLEWLNACEADLVDWSWPEVESVAVALIDYDVQEDEQVTAICPRARKAVGTVATGRQKPEVTE